MSTRENTAEQLHAAQRLRAPLTDRVNAEPAILHGMSVTEAKAIFLLSAAVFSFIAIIVFIVTHIWQLAVGIAFFGPLLTLWYGSQYLEVIKRGYPDGFYSQRIHLWMAARGLATPQFLTHDGVWSLGRPLVGLDLSAPLNPPPEKPQKPQDTAQPQDMPEEVQEMQETQNHQNTRGGDEA